MKLRDRKEFGDRLHRVLAAKPVAKPDKRGKNPAFGDLADPEYDKSLEEKYASLTHSYYYLAASAAHCYFWLHTIFNSYPFTQLSRYKTRFQTMDDFDDHFWWDKFSQYVSDMSITPQSVRCRINAPPFTVNVQTAPSSYSIGEDEKKHGQALIEANDVFKRMFNGFNLPQQWIVTEDKEMRPKIDRPIFSPWFTPDDLNIAKLGLRQIKFSEDWDGGKDGPKLEEPEKDKKESAEKKKKRKELAPNLVEDWATIKNYIKIQLEISNTGETMMFHQGGSMAMPPVGSVGKLDDLRTPTMTLEIIPHIYIEYPIEYALWATESTHPQKDFLPSVFLQLHNLRTGLATSKDQGKLPSRMGSLAKVVKNNEAIKEEFGLVPKPRVNEDDFLVTRSGNVLWVPSDANNVQLYTSLVQQAYDPESGKIKPLSTINGLANMVVLVDWINHKLVTTTMDGALAPPTDLSGSVPLTDAVINKALHIEFADPNITAFFESFVDKLAQKQGFIDKDPKFPALSSVKAMMEEMIAKHSTGPHPVTVVDIANENYRRKYFDEDEMGYAAAEELARLVVQCDRAFEKSEASLYNKIHSYKFLCTLFAKYAPDADKIHKRVEENYRANTVSEEKVDVDSHHFKVPNMPGLKGFTPHQAIHIAAVDKYTPKSTILDVSAGGGKSIEMIASILLLLSKGVIKRPLVIAPQNLLKQLINETVAVGKGKINAVPITGITVARMAEVLQLDSKGIVKFFRSAPPNTIFFTSYEFAKAKRNYVTGEESTDMAYGTATVPQFASATLLAACEFDFVAEDESHRAKNLDAQQAIAALIIMSGATYKLLSSGTIITDVATDLVGQIAQLNPGILGDKAEFSSRYGSDYAGGKLIKLRPTAYEEVKRKIREESMILSAKRRDWAYLLPDPQDRFYKCPMTDKQLSFYYKLLDEAEVRVKEEMLKSRKLRAQLEVDKSEEGELDESSSALMEMILERELAKVEQFISAPDENDEFMSLGGPEAPGAIDKVSPKVVMANRILAGHFNGKDTGLEIDEDTGNFNKVLIFCYHKSASRHMMRHLDPQFKQQALHYTASDEETLAKFIDPKNTKYNILVADETSIKEGFNLQMCSRMIRVQTLWSPGAHEQAMSRIFRPDPRGIYNREKVHLDWLVAVGPDGEAPTVDTAKTARLITKMIEKTKFDEANNPEWKEVAENYEGLEPLVMNLDLIRSIPYTALLPYFDKYKMLLGWESKQFDKKREKLRLQISKRLGRSITRAEVKKYAMRQIDEHTELVGSAPFYTPLVFGATMHDPYGLNLEPISSIVADDDEEGEETVKVSKGQEVMTEFGPGFIVGISAQQVKVKILGIGTVSLPKGVVFVPSTDVDPNDKKADPLRGRKRLANLINQGGIGGLPTVKRGGIIQSRPNPNKLNLDEGPGKVIFKDRVLDGKLPTDDEEDEAPKKDRKKKNADGVYVWSSLINNMPALVRYGDDDDTIDDDVFYRTVIPRGWTTMPASLFLWIPSYKAMEEFVEALDDKFALSPKRRKFLLQFAQTFRQSKGKLAHNGYVNFEGVKSIAYASRRIARLPGPGQPIPVDPMTVVWDGDIYVSFLMRDLRRSPAIERWLRNLKRKIPRLGDIETHERSMVKFFKSKNEARKELMFLHEMFTVPNLDDELEEIDSIQIYKGEGPAQFAEKPKAKEEERVIPKNMPTPSKPTGKDKITPTKRPGAAKPKPKATSSGSGGGSSSGPRSSPTPAQQKPKPRKAVGLDKLGPKGRSKNKKG